MRFPNISDDVANGPGTLRRTGSDVEVNLPLDNGGGQELQGSLQHPSAPRIGEYFLVFHDGVFWVERCNTSIHNVRETNESVEAPDPAPEQINASPHDEWNAPDFAISPITQHALSEDESENNDHADRAEEPKSQESSPSRHPSSSDSEGSESEGDGNDDDGEDVPKAHKGIGTKSVPRRGGGSGIPATKTVPDHHASSSDESDESSDSESDAGSYTDDSSINDAGESD